MVVDEDHDITTEDLPADEISRDEELLDSVDEGGLAESSVDGGKTDADRIAEIVAEDRASDTTLDGEEVIDDILPDNEEDRLDELTTRSSDSFGTKRRLPTVTDTDIDSLLDDEVSSVDVKRPRLSSEFPSPAADLH